MAEQRTKRDAESREVETRPSDSWLPASVLPNPLRKTDGCFGTYAPVHWATRITRMSPRSFGKAGFL